MKTIDDFEREVIDNLPKEINLYKDEKLREGGRKAAPISISDFKDKVDQWEPWDLFYSLEKDLKKIKFDSENFSELNDYRVTSSGINYILCWAGGDWEYPVHFMIYWDGKSFRAYIPTKGNTFRKDTKTAFGSEAENNYDSDEVDRTIYMLSQGCPDLIKGYTRKELENFVEETINKTGRYLLHDYLEPNIDWMIEDFEARIR